MRSSVTTAHISKALCLIAAIEIANASFETKLSLLSISCVRAAMWAAMWEATSVCWSPLKTRASRLWAHVRSLLELKSQSTTLDCDFNWAFQPKWSPNAQMDSALMVGMGNGRVEVLGTVACRRDALKSSCNSANVVYIIMVYKDYLCICSTLQRNQTEEWMELRSSSSTDCSLVRSRKTQLIKKELLAHDALPDRG
jgi:hypothetical protein